MIDQRRFLISAEAADRPGVVAALTGGLYREGWNIEDASMTRLAGRFAMFLVVAVPPTVERDAVRESAMSGLPGLVVDVHEAIPPMPIAEQGERWAVTVYGADRPGIVAEVTGLLAEHGVNIDELGTRTVGRSYTMLVEATVPEAVDTDALEAALDALAGRLDVRCSARPVDADTL